MEIPKRMVSHELELDLYDRVNQVANEAIMGIISNLHAEVARLTRLLPDPPLGWYWRFEEQASEDLPSGSLVFRVVAYLTEIEPYVVAP